MLTAQAVAEKLERPASTIRDWASEGKFRDFLPSQTRGNRNYYKESSLKVFERIQFLYREGKNTKSIKSILSGQFEETQDGDIVSEKALAKFQNIKIFSETDALLKTMIKKHDEIIKIQREELTVMKSLLIKRPPVRKKAVAKTKKKSAKVKKSRGVGRIIKTIFSEPFK